MTAVVTPTTPVAPMRMLVRRWWRAPAWYVGHSVPCPGTFVANFVGAGVVLRVDAAPDRHAAEHRGDAQADEEHGGRSPTFLLLGGGPIRRSSGSLRGRRRPGSIDLLDRGRANVSVSACAATAVTSAFLCRLYDHPAMTGADPDRGTTTPRRSRRTA